MTSAVWTVNNPKGKDITNLLQAAGWPDKNEYHINIKGVPSDISPRNKKNKGWKPGVITTRTVRVSNMDVDKALGVAKGKWAANEFCTDLDEQNNVAWDDVEKISINDEGGEGLRP